MKNKKVKILGKSLPLVAVLASVLIASTVIVYAVQGFDFFNYVIEQDLPTATRTYEQTFEITAFHEIIEVSLIITGSGEQGSPQFFEIVVTNNADMVMGYDIGLEAIGTGAPEVMLPLMSASIAPNSGSPILSGWWTPLEATVYTFEMYLDPTTWTE